MPRLRPIPESVRELKTEFLHCYALSHSWDTFPNDDWNVSSETLIDRPISFRCVECGTIRRDVWKRNSGELLARAYVYPEGYRLGKIDYGKRTRKETYRAEFLERL